MALSAMLQGSVQTTVPASARVVTAKAVVELQGTLGGRDAELALAGPAGAKNWRHWRHARCRHASQRRCAHPAALARAADRRRRLMRAGRGWTWPRCGRKHRKPT